MKKSNARPRPRLDPDRDTMRREYDFSKGIRGKDVREWQAGGRLVVLETDVAAVFKNSAAVNQALRRVLKARPSASRRKRSA
jgi:hypothetical protein